MTSRPLLALLLGAILGAILGACTAPDRRPYPETFEPSEEYRKDPDRWRLPAETDAGATETDSGAWSGDLSDLEPTGDLPPQRRSAGTADANATLLHQLETTILPGFVVRDEESLTKVVDQIRAMTGLPLVVDPAAEEAVLDAGVVFDFELTNPISVRDLLNLITSEVGGATEWRTRHEAVIVTTAEQAGGVPIVRAHDVRILTMERTDFRAPRIDRIRLLSDLEDPDGGGAFGGSESLGPRVEADALVDLVVANVAPGRWEEEGVSIRTENGFLFVVHERDVQHGVARFLADLVAF